jgi:RNA polymerase sigma factor (sigma-70 family)
VETMGGVSPGEWPRLSGEDVIPNELRENSTSSPTRVGAWGPESDLISGVRAGDPAAMAVLYDRHRGQGLRFARALLSGPQDAEDVLHEAFAKAVSAIKNGYGPTGAFGPYFSACIRSVTNSLWKKQARERPAADEDLDPGSAEDPGLENAPPLFEFEDVAVAMQALPARWRTVLWHAEVMGEPPRNIAPILGIEPNAVSALLIRARAGLRAAYELQSLPTDAARGTGNFN